jgi:ribonuclease R
VIEEFVACQSYGCRKFGNIKINNKPVLFLIVYMITQMRKVVAFIAFAKKFGHQFDISSPDAIASSFNQMLKEVHGKPRAACAGAIGD